MEVYIEINTGQARLVESMLISLREHVYVLFFHKWTTNRNWQHLVHETQNKDKQNKNTAQYVFNSTICIHTQLMQIRNEPSFKHRLYAEIVTDIITWNSKRTDT